MNTPAPQEKPDPGSSAHADPIGFGEGLDEFKRGWRILLLATLGIATGVTAAMLYAFGSFVVPLEQAFAWNRGDIQTTMTCFFCGGTLAIPLVSWLNQRYGLRRITLASLALSSLGYLSFLLLPPGANIIWLYIGFALLPLLGLGNLPVTWTQVIGLWFVRRRGLALAIALSGTAMAAGVFPSLVTWAIQHWDWRAGFVLMALPVLLLVLPLSLLWLKATPPTTTATASSPKRLSGNLLAGIGFKEALLMRKFWIFNLALVMVVSAVICMVTSMIPLLRDKGLSAAEASQVFGAFGISLMSGRMVVGFLIDRLWAPGVAAVALSMPALGCLLLSGTDTSTPVLMLAAALVGMGAGAEFDLSSFLLARYFGMRDYGRLYGLHLVSINILAALSPLLIGVLFKLTGNYSLVLTYCTLVFFGGATALLFLGRYPKFEPVLAD